VAATALGVGVFYAVPHELVKVVWGVSAAALAYLALSGLQARLFDRDFARLAKFRTVRRWVRGSAMSRRRLRTAERAGRQ